MSLKRLDRFGRTSVAAIGLSVALAASADAQLVNGRWQLPPKGTPVRQGVIVTPPPRPAPVFPANPSFPTQLVQPVVFTLVPAIVMSDGSIFANFGYGYERVLRPCSGGTVVVGQTRRIASNGVVLSNGSNTQPQVGQNGTNGVSLAAYTACFNRDNAGRVFVYKRS